MDHSDLLKKLDSTQRHERLMQRTQARLRTRLNLFIRSFVRSFVRSFLCSFVHPAFIHSFRRDDIMIAMANNLDVLKKHRVRKLQ